MATYYNEHDRFAAAWLRELISDGLIPAGDVDERDIRLVRPADLDGYTACHFFAGIAGWAYALRLAGWPDDRPVWTGSCPCQPFSTAGKGAGFGDPRHLWPAWFRLIRECLPPVVFGEQVAGTVGQTWLDLVSTDMEEEGYAFGAADLAAASVGAPHKRQRHFFVAYSEFRRSEGGEQRFGSSEAVLASEDCCSDSDSVANAQCGASERHGLEMAGAQGAPAQAVQERQWVWSDTRHGRVVGVAQDTNDAGLQGREPSGVACGMGNAASHGCLGGGEQEHRDEQGPSGLQPDGPSALRSWDGAVPIECADGFRLAPIEPALFPLADGVSNRVGILRGAGNAIVPQVAAEFVCAFLAAEAGMI